jgi:hypothetical protein
LNTERLGVTLPLLKKRLNSLKFSKKYDARLAPRLLAWLLLTAIAVPISLRAQTNPGPPGSNHYVLLVETSRAMSRRAHGVAEATREILNSRLKGEWQAGDTLAVWTFDEDLDTNSFPTVKLPLEAQAGTGAQLIRFLEGQAYDKRVSLDKVMPKLNRLVAQADFLTVILISAGDTELHGTPFDAPINQAYRQWQEEQKKLRLPFVTVFRAGHGKFTHWSVTPAQWPLELPPFPPELKFAPVKSSKPAEVPGKSAPSAPQVASASVTSTQLPNAANALVREKSVVQPETKTAPATIPAPSPGPKPQPAPPPSAAVAARIETRQTLALAGTPEPKPVKLAFAAWQPFDQTLPNWLAAEALPDPPNAPMPGHSAPASSSARNETRQPKASASAIEAKPFEVALADWEPFDEAMKKWPAAADLPALPKAPAPETTIQPAPSASPAVPPTNVALQETETAQATILEPVTEPLVLPVSPALARMATVEVSPSNPVIEPGTIPVATAVPDVAVAPSNSFLRENAAALATLLLASVAGGACFLKWFRSYLRPALKRPIEPDLAIAMMTAPQRNGLDSRKAAPHDPSAIRLRATV